MAELRASININLSGNLSRIARRNGDALEALGRRGKGAMRGLGTAVGAVGKRLKGMANRYTALFSLAGIALGAKKIIDFDAALASLGSRGGKTGKDLDAFVLKTKKLLFATAKKPELNISTDELLSGMNKILEKTGDLDLALRSLPNLGLMIRGGESEGADAGALIAELNQKMKIGTKKEMSGALGDITALGDMGAFEVKQLAPLAERIFGAWVQTQRKGREGVREAMTILQMFKRTTGSPEMAVTAFERFMDVLGSEKTEELRAAGIRIWDPEQLKKGLNVMRSPIKILKEILLKADAAAGRRRVGIGEILAKIFDIRSRRGVTAFVDVLQSAKARGKPGEAFKDVDAFLSVSGGETLLRQRSAELAKKAKRL